MIIMNEERCSISQIGNGKRAGRQAEKTYPNRVIISYGEGIGWFGLGDGGGRGAIEFPKIGLMVGRKYRW